MNFGILSIRPLLEEYNSNSDFFKQYNWSKYFEKYIIAEERTGIDQPWSHLHIAFQLRPNMPTTTDSRRKMIITRNKDMPKFKDMKVSYNIKYGDEDTDFSNSCAYVSKDFEGENPLGRKIGFHNITPDEFIKISDNIKIYKMKKAEHKNVFKCISLAAYIPLLFEEYIKLCKSDPIRNFEHKYIEEYNEAKINLSIRGIFNLSKEENVKHALEQYTYFRIKGRDV